MTEINQEIENMIAEMRVIGQLPAPCRRGNRNNLIKYQDLKCKILERFLSAFESGYRLSVPVSREQVEKVWRGYWDHKEVISNKSITGKFLLPSCECSLCGCYVQQEVNFCPHCGAPMTDEAVQMVMERMEELKNEIG